MSEATGISGGGTGTTIATMVAPDGRGADSVALVSICIDSAYCGEITKAHGAGFEPTGQSTDTTITTRDRGGSGQIGTERSGVTGTACACTSVGLVLTGEPCEVTGICTGAITTITTCMAGTDGHGVDTVELEFICTACGRSTATIRVIGVGSDLIGISGEGTTTTSDLVGSGQGITVGLGATCTDCASIVVGTAVAGTTCGATGSCGVATITITTTMAALSGVGVDTAALVCTSTVCERCTETTKATGVVFAPTGICIAEITTTRDLVGSGDDTARLAVTSIACEFSGAGMVLAGTTCEPIGICTVGITTITTCMAGTSGCGDATDALVFICTVSAPCTETTKAIGAESERIGTCGDATTITSDHDGSGPTITKKSDGTGTACVSSAVGMGLVGTTFAVTGISTVVTTTTITFMVGTSGSGEGSEELECTSTVSAPCTETTKVIGAECAPIGICTGATTTTSDLGGSGASGVAFTDTCTACAS